MPVDATTAATCSDRCAGPVAAGWTGGAARLLKSKPRMTAFQPFTEIHAFALGFAIGSTKLFAFAQ